jgi:lauroyl/myristoyl acyltransferase
MSVQMRDMKVTARDLFTKEDAYFSLELPALFAISWLMPERSWRSACYRLEQVKSGLGFFSPQKVADTASRVLSGAQLGGDPTTFALRHAASRSEHHLQILQAHRPGGWKSRLQLEGEKNLQNARDAGRGAVLWIAHFSFNALAAKKAISDAGYKVWHLSRPEHGFSKSRFGIRFFNPIRVNAELKFLGGRIIIDRADPRKAKNEAEKVLSENEFISITAGAWEGRRVAQARLLGGTLELATGAPDFAQRSGAALLPVFTVRDNATGIIRVVVDPPITAPTGMEKVEQYAAMTQEFADRLEPYVLAHPEQWRDWKSLKL